MYIFFYTNKLLDRSFLCLIWDVSGKGSYFQIPSCVAPKRCGGTSSEWWLSQGRKATHMVQQLTDKGKHSNPSNSPCRGWIHVVWMAGSYLMFVIFFTLTYFEACKNLHSTVGEFKLNWAKSSIFGVHQDLFTLSWKFYINNVSDKYEVCVGWGVCNEVYCALHIFNIFIGRSKMFIIKDPCHFLSLVIPHWNDFEE